MNLTERDPSQALLADREWRTSYRHEDGEERWHAIGVLDGRTMVTVVHTYRSEGSGEIIRIVSARRADAQERKQYAETL